MCHRLCHLLGSWKCSVLARNSIVKSDRRVLYCSSSCKFSSSFYKINATFIWENEWKNVPHLFSNVSYIPWDKMLNIILISMSREFISFGIYCSGKLNSSYWVSGGDSVFCSPVLCVLLLWIEYIILLPFPCDGTTIDCMRTNSNT